MDISQANKQAEILLGRHAEVRYDAEVFEYQIGFNVMGEFILYGASNQSWEDALELTKQIKSAHEAKLKESKLK